MKVSKKIPQYFPGLLSNDDVDEDNYYVMFIICSDLIKAIIEKDENYKSKIVEFINFLFEAGDPEIHNVIIIEIVNRLQDESLIDERSIGLNPRIFEW